MESYKVIRKKYIDYLRAYRSLNRGSLVGATTFQDFYVMQTYKSIYSDPRILALMGYN